MRLLITGGCGFIGSAVVRHLIRATDHIVTTVDLMTYAACDAALEDALDHPRHRLIRADVADGRAMRQILAVHRPEAIMHLAAESHVDRSIDAPAAFIHSNILGTYALLDAARDYWQGLDGAARDGFRFHHVSTDEVFGALAPDAPPFTAASRYDPRSPYAASKAASDHLVRAWHHTYGLPTLVSNTTNNYGPWQFPEKLIPLMLLNALDGKPLPVYGDGTNRRDWLFVEDHAEALVKVLLNGAVGATYCIGARQPRSNIEVVQALCAILDRRLPDGQGPRARLIRFVADRPGHDFRYEIDPSEAQKALSWYPAHDFEAGLERTVDWYLAHRAWGEDMRRTRYDGQRLEATPP